MGNNTGHHLLLFATTHFSPNSPTFEKKFAKSAFFRKFNKILPRTMQSYERIVEKHKNRLLSNNTGHYLLLIATTHFSPNSPTFEKKFTKSPFFRKFNKILPRTMQSYERIVEKHKNRLLSNNTGHYLLLIATTHFSPNSPTFEKKFAKSAFFRKFNKILPRTMQSYERIVEKHKNRLLSNNTGHYLLLIATTHFSTNSPTFEKKFAKSAFFRKCNKILPRTMQSYERIVEKHKNRLLSNNAGHHLLLLAPTHFSPSSPTFQKKFAKSAFFRKFNKILPRTMQSYERIVEKHKNRLLSNNTGHYLLLIATTHFSTNSPTFEKKFAKSAFFRKHNKILPRTMQSYERIVEKHKNRLMSNNTGHYLLLIATTHFSTNSPTFEKKFAKSAFFRKSNKILPRTMQSYERIVEKHKNRLLSNNAGHHLLLLAPTHFSPSSPTFQKKFAKSAFFRKFNKILPRTMQSYEPIVEKHKNRLLSNNTGHYLLLIATTHFSTNSPTFEKKFAKSAFFRKCNKIIPRTMQSYVRIVEKHKNRLLSNNAGHHLLLLAPTHFSPSSPTFQKKFAKSAFFRKFN